MRVDYDLQKMVSNRRLRNLFFEAVDVHADLWFNVQKRCQVIEKMSALITESVDR